MLHSLHGRDRRPYSSYNNAHSWKTHLQAAQIQQYQPILDLVHELKDDNIPVIYYHRKCHGTVYLPWRRILIGFVKLPRGKAAILNPWVNLERRSSPFFLARIACMSWPPKQSKLTVDAVQVSDSVWAFLPTSLTGNTEPRKFCSQRVQCLGNSFGQDLVLE